MAYTSMKKLINNLNAKYNNGIYDDEQYTAYKESYSHKIDVFFAASRITEKQYNELMAMFIDIDATEETTTEEE